MTKENKKNPQPPIEEEYILAGRVYFRVGASTLQDKKLQLEVKLQRPASRCLALLIQHQGTLVSQNELLVCGWGEMRARYVTMNAFYQSMFHLRQSLKMVGLEDVIYTIHRQGTGLNIALSILTVPPRSLPIPKRRQHQRFALHLCGYLVITLLIVLSVVQLLAPLHVNKSMDSYFNNYFFTSLQQCSLYRYPRKLSDNSVNILLHRTGINCQNKLTIFITASETSDRKSLTICKNNPQFGKQSCRISFIMDHIDEKTTG